MMNSLTKVQYFTTNCLKLLLKNGFTPVHQDGQRKSELQYLKDVITMFKESPADVPFLKFEFTLNGLSSCNFTVSSVNGLIFLNMCNSEMDSYSMCYRENNIIKSNRKVYICEDFDAQFLEKIVNPIRCNILINSNIPCSTLLGLPGELIKMILDYCTHKSIYNLSITCKIMNGLCREKVKRMRLL